MLSTALVIFLTSASLMKVESSPSLVTGTVGKCRTVQTQESMNFTQFATDQGGKWLYKKMPATTASPNLDRLNSVELVKSKKTEGAYDITFYYRSNDCKPAILIDGVIFDTMAGHATAQALVGKKKVDFKFWFLKYEPGKYAYYYVCSDEGTDTKTDYRYVVSHGALTKEAEDAITKIENQYKFHGSLKNIVWKNCK